MIKKMKKILNFRRKRKTRNSKGAYNRNKAIAAKGGASAEATSGVSAGAASGASAGISKRKLDATNEKSTVRDAKKQKPLSFAEATVNKLIVEVFSDVGESGLDQKDFDKLQFEMMIAGLRMNMTNPVDFKISSISNGTIRYGVETKNQLISSARQYQESSHRQKDSTNTRCLDLDRNRSGFSLYGFLHTLSMHWTR